MTASVVATLIASAIAPQLPTPSRRRITSDGECAAHRASAIQRMALANSSPNSASELARPIAVESRSSRHNCRSASAAAAWRVGRRRIARRMPATSPMIAIDNKMGSAGIDCQMAIGINRIARTDETRSARPICSKSWMTIIRRYTASMNFPEMDRLAFIEFVHPEEIETQRCGEEKRRNLTTDHTDCTDKRRETKSILFLSVPSVVEFLLFSSLRLGVSGGSNSSVCSCEALTCGF